MEKFLTKILNKITMYRLMLYFLLFLFIATIFLSFLNILPYNPFDIFLTGVYLIIVCKLSNWLFSKIFKTKTNLESSSITALILTLIIGPLPLTQNVLFFSVIGISAMFSKYFFVWRKKHIFNPAAFAILLGALIFNQGASWYIGNINTFLFIIAGGFLILTKIKRLEMVLSFLLVYFAAFFLNQDINFSTFLTPAIWFFVFVMLVEPLTSPSTKKYQIIFGAIIALLYFAFSRIIPEFAYGFETSLLIGNFFIFLISPSSNMVLIFRKKEKVAKNTWSFYFESIRKFKFIPGQYLELTYQHQNPDSRGVRRFFTISSSPNEKYIAVTTKVTEKGSSFKNELLKIKRGDQIIASNPKGDFVLPKNGKTHLAFIAGGIGITPFRSITKFLLESDARMDIVLFYSNNTENDVAFKKLFDEALKVGVISHYVITEKDGYIDEKMIKEKIADYKNRAFYVSGPTPMVDTFKETLTRMKVKEVKTDYFPGYIDI